MVHFQTVVCCATRVGAIPDLPPSASSGGVVFSLRFGRGSSFDRSCSVQSNAKMPRSGSRCFWNSASFQHEARATFADLGEYVQHDSGDLQKYLWPWRIILPAVCYTRQRIVRTCARTPARCRGGRMWLVHAMRRARVASDRLAPSLTHRGRAMLENSKIFVGLALPPPKLSQNEQNNEQNEG